MNNKDLNFIEKYFDGALSTSELAEFESRKNTDPEFAEALVFREDLKGAFVLGGELEALEQAMKEAEAKLKPEKEPRKINWYKKWAAAASVLLVASIGFNFMKAKQRNTEWAAFLQKEERQQQDMYNNEATIAGLKDTNIAKEKMYKEEMETANTEIVQLNILKQKETEKNKEQTIAYQNLKKQLQDTNEALEALKKMQAQQAEEIANLNRVNIALNWENEFWKSSEGLALNESTTRHLDRASSFDNESSRGDSVADSLLQAGRKKYKNKDYEGAIADFDEYLQNHPTDNEILFYKGMCYTFKGSKGYPSAISIFEQLLKKKEYYKKVDELEWHLALLYTRTGQFERAKKKLVTIVDMEAPVHNRRADAQELLSYF